MAIRIQDMDMPTQCSQCPFGFRTDNAHTACSRKPMENPVEDGDERPRHCPLKEVKEGIKPICKIIFNVPYYFCGDCKAMLNMYSTKAKFCSRCGQIVRWE